MPNNIAIEKNEGIVANKIDKVNYYRESSLRKLINKIVLKVEEEEISSFDSYDTEEYTIEDKITFNCLDEYWKEAIYEVPSYDKAINETLDEGEETYPKRSIFLRAMNRNYKKAKKELNIGNDQDEICKRSADILDAVRERYMRILENDTLEDYDEMCVTILIAFGFCECKVLEKPYQS